MSDVRTRGHALAAARRGGVPLAELPGGLPHNEAEAYSIQAAATDAYGDQRAGYKIGATSSAAQAIFGTDHPFCAPLFAGDCWADGSAIDVPEYGLVGIEAEFAFRLSDALPARDQAYTLDDVRAVVGAVHPAFEIVGLRLPRELFSNMSVVIADLGANVGFVSGAGVTDWEQPDLGGVDVRVDIDGETVAHGSGAAVLGHPLNALLWLAEDRRVSGNGLAAGDFVSTGACAGIINVAPGQHALADFGPFGSVVTVLNSI